MTRAFDSVAMATGSQFPECRHHYDCSYGTVRIKIDAGARRTKDYLKEHKGGSKKDGVWKKKEDGWTDAGKRRASNDFKMVAL